MKKAFVLVLGLLVAWSVFAQHPFEYLYPIPASQLHSKYTDIIIRPGSLITEEQLAEWYRVEVVGLNSGQHEVEIKLKENRRTIILKPKQAFAPGETVWVHIPNLLVNDTPTGVYSFHFSISQHKKYEKSVSLPAPSLSKTDTLPANFPDIQLESFGDSFDGQLFLTPTSNPNKLVILPENGIPSYVNTELSGFLQDFNVQQGMLTFNQLFGQVRYLAMDSTYTVVDTFQCQNGLTTDTHDMILLPNGNAYLISYDQDVIDMSQVFPGGQEEAGVTGLVIQEVDPQDDVVFEWRSWDHYEILDGIHQGTDTIDFTNQLISYVHCNSIDIDADNNLIISNRNMDEVTKFSRVTGEIIWRLGGKNNQFTFINDPFNGFNAQHDARRLPNGNLTVFDNGLFHDSPVTRVVEYALDESNMTATLVRSINSPLGVTALRSGNMQYLENGNWLIGWGRADASGTYIVTEVDPDNNLVFSMTALQGSGFGWSYRAFKHPWPGKLTTSITQPTTDEIAFQLRPNLTSSEVRLTFTLPPDTDQRFRIFNVQGQLVWSGLVPAGTKEYPLELSSLSSGVYFVNIGDTAFSYSVRKLVHSALSVGKKISAIIHRALPPPYFSMVGMG